MYDFKEEIEEFIFKYDIEFIAKEHRDTRDPYFVLHIINKYKDKDTLELQQALNAFNKTEMTICKEDIKKVFIMLKDRKIHPTGIFDRAGRFFILDNELVDVAAPSSKYRFSEMKAGRTSKFVKDIAQKYRVKNKHELMSLFI